MDISIFSVSGPVMIGPSSSHTAGAAKLAYVARKIVAEPFDHVSFGLYGSFAQTYRGHGTDRALVAGALGLKEDDERLANSFSLAEERGLSFDFYETDLPGLHENSVKITFTLENGKKETIIGSSIGGGQIVIRQINGYDVDFDASMPTLLIHHIDQVGVMTSLTSTLSDHNVNIAVMKLSRKTRGGNAFCILETDDLIPDCVIDSLKKVPHILGVERIQIDDDAHGEEEEPCTIH